ncbi:uncharacterized protein LOC128213225 isoform X1 [Mya arenaria]|uniref:uncharacterized protein LOC128213225 isoform X1 n=1 Tax=Mya arenaria TaxID=6604 RepID=UPI0022DEC329|nr:uncharacterized protein LOC128213225 isoform X1 [Mya arenaria]XP_052774746.1 uncharacterized protein LOC128213225 isoform X1 [Mya arenaria]
MTWKILLLYMLYNVVFAEASAEVKSADFPEMNHQKVLKNISLPECKFSVANESKRQFRSRLRVFDVNLIRFRIRWNSSNVMNSTLPGVFQPDLWVWSYRLPLGNFSYLTWNLEYGTLSFSILETKLYAIRYIDLVTTQKKCSVTFGSTETTSSISHSLMEMVHVFKHDVPKYEYNYMCYLSEVPGIRTSFAYKAGLYFSYPVTFLNYKCCTYAYSFYKLKFIGFDCNKFVDKWQLLTHGPYFFGLILLLFFPIFLFAISAGISEGDQIIPRNVEMGPLLSTDTPGEDWVYLDGNSPLTVLNVLSQPLDCLRRNHPILNSRLRRLICVVFAPMLIYLKLYMFKDGYLYSYNEKVTSISVRDLVKFGKPIGFLALYGDISDMNKTFVPILGGPIVVMILYFSLAIILIVCPKSLKQIVHNGLPRKSDVSPLFDGNEDIPRSRVCYRASDRGYKRASEICKQRVYLLITTDQWRRVFSIQRKRFESDGTHSSLIRRIIKPLTFSIQVFLCMLEVFIYVLFFLFPLFTFGEIMIKGTVVTIMDTRNSFKKHGFLVSNSVVWFFITGLGLGAVIVFGYCVCLVFLESFIYLAQIALYCFVALIVFPAIAFGYLFFFATIVYYLAHLLRDFGDGYSRLLEITVNKCIDLEGNKTVLVLKDETITIRVNGEEIVPIETQIKIQSRVHNVQMVMHKDFAPGIPRELFNKIVQEKRPVNAQMMNLIVHLTIIITLITLTLTLVSEISAGFTTDQSEVLHIVFTVIVGFIPKLVEMFLKGGSEIGSKEIEKKAIGEIVEKFWENRV